MHIVCYVLFEFLAVGYVVIEHLIKFCSGIDFDGVGHVQILLLQKEVVRKNRRVMLPGERLLRYSFQHHSPLLKISSSSTLQRPSVLEHSTALRYRSRLRDSAIS